MPVGPAVPQFFVDVVIQISIALTSILMTALGMYPRYVAIFSDGHCSDEEKTF
jgi:hypothetical protein